MSKHKRISEVTLYEVYIDLWGMKYSWIHAIQDKILDFAESIRNEECEAYHNEACMAIRFTTPDKERAKRVKALFNSLYNLAKRTSKDPDKVMYSLQCG